MGSLDGTPLMATNCNCCSCVVEADYGTSFITGTGTQSDPFQVFQTDPGWVRPMSRVTRATNQSIPNNTNTAVSFSSSVFDTDTMWSGANPTRLTINTAGLYMFGVNGIMVLSGVGIREYSFRVNGLTTIDFTDKLQPDPTYFSYNYPYELQASDYIEIMIRQTSGAPLDLLAGGGFLNACYFWACYLGKVI